MTMNLETNINSRILRLLINADIIATDKDGNPVLLVDVRINTMSSQISPQIIDSLEQAHGNIPFAMLVNLEQISIYKWSDEPWQNPICIISTVEVLSQYEPHFGKKRIFHTYFTSLVEAWLRDLAYNWHSQYPPFFAEIQRIGLLEKLANGTTEEEVNFIEVKI